MDTLINMLDAKTSLSRLVQALEDGSATEFVIARNGRPAARLVPLKAPCADKSRRIGAARGRFRVPANIDAANAEIARLFAGG
jgi:antitoxin (DNA-binding transcriptional repressor) of toxin-antitoxin stability system